MTHMGSIPINRSCSEDRHTERLLRVSPSDCLGSIFAVQRPLSVRRELVGLPAGRSDFK
jgi:hypothetical protein